MRWSAPTGRCRATPAERIRDLRLRPWLATIVLNLCRSRIGRRATAGRPALSLDAAEPGTMEPPADERSGPAATDRPTRRRAERGRICC